MSSIRDRQHYHSTDVPTNGVELTPELARADPNLFYFYTHATLLQAKMCEACGQRPASHGAPLSSPKPVAKRRRLADGRPPAMRMSSVSRWCWTCCTEARRTLVAIVTVDQWLNLDPEEHARLLIISRAVSASRLVYSLVCDHEGCSTT